MKRAFLITLITIVTFSLGWFAKDAFTFSKAMQNDRFADYQLKTAKPFYKPLIEDRETAIAVVEPILFKIYGKANIIAQRPYQTNLVDGNWHISGTLGKDLDGGSFEIILSAADGKVLKLTHGK